MRSLYIVPVLVAFCSVAVLARWRSNDGSDSQYTTTPAALADPPETPAPVDPYAPVAQDASTPLVEETTAPVIEGTPYPAASVDTYKTTAPVAEDVDAAEETPAPLVQDPYAATETPAPVAQDIDATEETTTLAAQDAYAAEETPAPVAQDIDATEETTTLAAQDPYAATETPAPVAQDIDAAEETTTLAAQDPYAAEETSEPLAQDVITTPEEETTTLAVQDPYAAEETTASLAQDAITSPTPVADLSNYRRAHRRQRQAISTTARPGSNATEESGNATATCTGAAACFHDDDCGSTGDKKGRCIGVFNGKCNCNACLNFISCTDDSACGGLKGACNTTTSRCSCDEGYKANGFAGGFLDAFRELCNVKDCNADNHAEQCFGLPCNSGLCVC